jgi:cytochrome c-type biogenesis protein CcmH
MPEPLAADGSPRARRPRPLLGLVVLALVLAGALAVGGGLFSSTPQSNAQRAAAIDAQLRCPSCIDETVADSSASAAVAVRHEVAHLVAEGQTNSQIDADLVSRYGPSILLRPPTTGLAAAVWVVPAVAGAIALGAVAVLFWRRSRQLGRFREEVDA